MVVLPTPGGPHSTNEARVPRASMRVSVPSGPSRWSWPTTSSSERGRRRSASGRAVEAAPAVSGGVAGPNRSAAEAGRVGTAGR